MERHLKFALLLSLSLFFLEFIGGFLSGSLALLSDSFHLFSDNFSLILSFFALRVSKRPPTPKATFGYQKLGVLVTALNGLLLLISALFILLEAYERLNKPLTIDLRVMLPVAILGLGGNLAMLKLLHGHHQNFHIKSAWLHVLGDTLSSIFVLLTGFIIHFTRFYSLDTITSLFIVLLLFIGGINVLRSSFKIFLDLTPSYNTLEQIINQLKSHEGVKDVHDVHYWSIGHGVYAFTAHIRIKDQPLSSADEIRKGLEKKLRDLGVTHFVLQMETTTCEKNGLFCDDLQEKSNHGDAS